ncbi:hypothetical protein F2Q68_00030744 [Brassica cretica]|uniref:Uncharacterized protein n=1 Tax=Brassica cretica TaxID=69181 RepID=A0A8S9GDA6_BRACR|nr:hypothetical protein F2Q68_00030744 [Brassica cretica]
MEQSEAIDAGISTLSPLTRVTERSTREATREGSRGVEYPLARARRIIEVRRGEGDAGDPHLPLPALPKCLSRSHAGEAARDHSPARTKKEHVEGPTRGG